MIPTTGSATGDIQHIIDQRKRQWKLLAILSDPWGLLLLWVIAIVVLGLALVHGRSHGLAHNVTAQIEDPILHPKRVPFTQDQTIDLTGGSRRHPEIFFPNPDPEKPETMIRAGREFGWQQMAANLKTQAGKNQRVYVIQGRTHPFEKNYESFPARLDYKPLEPVNLKIIDGVVFLREDVKPGGPQTPTLHQLRFDRDGNGIVIDNGIQIEEPNDGEYLWMLVLVEGNNLADATLNSEGFHLRRK